MEQEPIVQRYTLYIVLAVLFLTIGLPRVVGGQPGTFKDAVDLSGGLITIGTLLTPKKKPGDLPATRRQDFRLAPSFMSGWYGGIVGGRSPASSLASPIILRLEMSPIGGS